MPGRSLKSSPDWHLQNKSYLERAQEEEEKSLLGRPQSPGVTWVWPWQNPNGSQLERVGKSQCWDRCLPRLTACPLSPWCPHQAWLSGPADDPEQEVTAVELWLKTHRSAAEPRGKHQAWLCHQSQLSEPLAPSHHPGGLSGQGEIPCSCGMKVCRPGCLCSWAHRSVGASSSVHSLYFQCCMIENKCSSSSSRREAVKGVAKEKIRSQVQRFTQVYCIREVAYSKLLPNDCSVIPLVLNSSLCNFLFLFSRSRMLIHFCWNFSRIHIYGRKWETLQVSHSDSQVLSCLSSSPKPLLHFIMETFIYKDATGKKRNPEIIALWCQENKLSSLSTQHCPFYACFFSRTVVLKELEHNWQEFKYIFRWLTSVSFYYSSSTTS